MDTKALRQKILDLAIRGKLVPQDPNDEPASVLLERIRAQKQQMVKEGKLKAKDIKNDTVIFVGEDNLHYEKHADGTVKCIEDEIPFEVPEGWAWCRLATIIELFITGPFGSALHKSDYIENGTPIINPMNIVDGRIIASKSMMVSDETVDRLSSFMVEEKDIIIARRGEMGRCAVVTSTEAGWLCGTGSFDIRLSGFVNTDYIAHYIRSPFSIAILAGNALGNTMPNLNQSILKSLLVPIPPQAEQVRINIGINRSDVLISRIEEDQAELIGIIAKLKDNILNLAIRGQLIPQNPCDDPASVLLDHIRAEKEKLIKQGKIKRDKRESVIFRGEDNSYYERVGTDVVDITEELPFPIPETWCWARMSTLFEINPRNKLDDSLEVSFIPMPLIEDGYSGKHGSEKRKWSEVRTGFSHFADGDIGIAKITPCFENRKSVVFQNLTNGFGAGTTELHVLRPYGKLILPEYALALVKTRAFIEDGKQEFTGAVGQQRIGKDFISEYLFPIPPYQEQERIVNAIEQIFHIINEIEQSIG